MARRNPAGDTRRWWLPNSLEARGIVLIVLVAAAIGLPAFFVSRALVARDQQAHAAIEEALLAVALRAYLYTASDVGPEYDAWLERLAEQELRVRWAGVYDSTGRGVEFRRRTNLPTDDILAQIPAGITQPQVKPLVLAGRPSERFALLTIPAADGSGYVAAVVDLGEATAGADVTWYVGGLFCAAVIGLALALGWFYFAVQRPVQELGRQVNGIRLGLARVALADDAPEELRGLVRSLKQTEQELRRWRAEADELRHSLDDRVDVKTRRMSRRLNRAERAAETDALTGLRNRRTLERALPELVEQQRAAGEELCALWIDVDRFKELNDALGHSAGDETLAFLGELLRATVRRSSDMAVRYGGDEFVLLLPGTRLDEAVAVAHRLRGLFAQRAKLVTRAEVRPDLSIGVAALRAHGLDSGPALLAAADAAMYRAKGERLGVATADETEVEHAKRR